MKRSARCLAPGSALPGCPALIGVAGCLVVAGGAGAGGDQAMAVLAQVLFDERVLEQITLYKDLLLKVATSEKSQKGLLGGLERVVGKTHPKIMGKMPHILKVRPARIVDLVSARLLMENGETRCRRVGTHATRAGLLRRRYPS